MFAASAAIFFQEFGFYKLSNLQLIGTFSL